MTFTLDSHKEKSKFHRVIVKNIMQLIRTYYPALVMKYKNSSTTRNLSFRKIPTKEDMIAVTTEKYCACNLRKDAITGTIWAIEIRIPDGTSDWAIIKEQVLLYMCLIRHAAKVSHKGLITIPRPWWNKVRAFSNDFSLRTSNYSRMKTQIEAQLKTILQEEEKFFTYQDTQTINYENNITEGD